MREPKYEKSKYENCYLPYDDMDTNILCHKVKLVKTRKECKCVYCGTVIQAGDFAQAERGFLDDMEHKAFYVHNCLDCVEEYMIGLSFSVQTWISEVELSNVPTVIEREDA